MKFDLLDAVPERSPDRIVAIKQVSRAEEYLADHFPRFPILPGVLMLETMVQAARLMLADRSPGRLVLGEVRALKYGAMVHPGESLRVEVTLGAANPDGSFQCRGTGTVRRGDGPGDGPDETAVTGRFTMRPVRVGATAATTAGAPERIPNARPQSPAEQSRGQENDHHGDEP